MQVNITCDCGQAISVDPARSGHTIQCPACKRLLAVPYFAAQPYPQAARGEPTSGLAIASLVLGVIAMSTAFCLGPIGIIVGSLAVILGVVALLKRRGGRPLSIVGISVGGVGLVISLSMTAFLAVPWFVWRSSVRSRSAMVQPVATAPTVLTQANSMLERATARPPILSAAEINDALAGPRTENPDPAAAAGELARALVLYERRQRRPSDLYECVKHFRLYLAYKGGGQFDDPAHARKFQTAREELLDKALPAYRLAEAKERAGKWAEAHEAYMEAGRLAPDSGNAFWENVSQHLLYCTAVRATSRPSR